MVKAQREGEGDSPRVTDKVTGGRIPGASGIAAYVLEHSEPSAVPVLIAVPHAGRAYPRALLREMRNADVAALRLEDRHVDQLARTIARETGAALLVAQAPRAMIDLNRAPEDVDWEMFGKSAREKAAGRLPSARARSGLGLIPRRLPGLGEIWRRRHEEADLAARIAQVHVPYHEALAQTLAGLRARWGAALLVDLHSMPPLPPRLDSSRTGFVVGDRFGASCNGGLVATLFSSFAQAGHEAAHNRPYAGGYVLERHADPRGGLHGLQIEIDRTLYLDSRLVEPGPGMAATAELLVGVVRRLAAQVAELGQAQGGSEWSQAAE